MLNLSLTLPVSVVWCGNTHLNTHCHRNSHIACHPNYHSQVWCTNGHFLVVKKYFLASLTIIRWFKDLFFCFHQARDPGVWGSHIKTKLVSEPGEQVYFIHKANTTKISLTFIHPDMNNGPYLVVTQVQLLFWCTPTTCWFVFIAACLKITHCDFLPPIETTIIKIACGPVNIVLSIFSSATELFCFKYLIPSKHISKLLSISLFWFLKGSDSLH